MSTQLNELRLQVERLDYDNKEGAITIDILKEQNQDAKSELEELRKQILDLKTSQKDIAAEDKEKRKQEKMAIMMAKFDTVCDSYHFLHFSFTKLSYLLRLTLRCCVNFIARSLFRKGRTITTDTNEIRQYRCRWVVVPGRSDCDQEATVRGAKYG
jgi:hypothetical protein